ncbi:hypothetical protein PpBr36_03949 [Pyricularia pennisetigena]|uniref:hypothetical protein n=1 Tax=Pyricularia pennisetigena TaxID=1578925 RepID=UPI001151E6FB|nr:hypothetical protein PpBr36_03949 [Pyricularia pennisetigena]TLS29949.1 hypothetical protein PpBr36_03949 [Pyricularia pennisetigena]
MMATDKQTTLTASCLCAANSFTAKTAADSLPLSAGCCHCDSCRRLTGNLYSVCAPWPVEPDLSGLRQYSMSPRISTFSCDKCGSTLFCQVAGLEWIYVILGMVDADNRAAAVVAKYGSHMWVGDTLDGGASGWIERNAVGGEEIRRWREHRGEELTRGWGQDFAAAQKRDAAVPEKTLIGCHCGGVALVLRSAAARRDERGPLPECVHPESLRYRANICACDSCRRASGAEVTPWATVPLSHIEAVGAAGFPASIHALKDAVDKGQFGSLTYFESSENVERYRCGVCSAGVFWAVHDQVDTVCVAVGVLQGEGGARKEGLLEWEFTRGVLFKEDVKGTWREGFVAALEQSEEWQKGVAQEKKANFG